VEKVDRFATTSKNLYASQTAFQQPTKNLSVSQSFQGSSFLPRYFHSGSKQNLLSAKSIDFKGKNFTVAEP
jgi:hypothetical protein